MLLTTLCYIEQDGNYLMLYRNKKENDINEGKWIGVGGRFEEGETPEECMMREVKEETGLTVESFIYRGLVTFIQEDGIIEYMHLYTINGFSGDLIECNEGTLKWIKKEEVFGLKLWEGDKIFLKLLLEEKDYFSLKLRYQGEILIEAKEMIRGIDYLLPS